MGRTSVIPFFLFLLSAHYPLVDPITSHWRSCRETTRVWMLGISWVPKDLLRRFWTSIVSWRRAGGYRGVSTKYRAGYERI
jgi:hypothetical protein